MTWKLLKNNGKYITIGGKLAKVWVPDPGIDFRVPTAQECEDEISTWDSQDAAGAFGSVLKLPLGGVRDNFDPNANILSVGVSCDLWSSTTTSVNSVRLLILNNNIIIGEVSRGTGNSVRLIKHGTFSHETYQPETLEIHGLTYNTVFNPDTGKVWLDRNLGATKVAESLTDSDAYGWLYQWGRATDGHQLRDSDTHDGDALGFATTAEPNQGNAWDGKIIVDPEIINEDWLETPNNDLWQGVDGINNPAKN